MFFPVGMEKIIRERFLPMDSCLGSLPWMNGIGFLVDQGGLLMNRILSGSGRPQVFMPVYLLPPMDSCLGLIPWIRVSADLVS